MLKLLVVWLMSLALFMIRPEPMEHSAPVILLIIEGDTITVDGGGAVVDVCGGKLNCGAQAEVED